jgi:hypothetical protein
MLKADDKANEKADNTEAKKIIEKGKDRKGDLTCRYG